jgi:aspartyl-tRNA(Asn)/glutamyl-tRNA(Gln) amidotransferase subunit B
MAEIPFSENNVSAMAMASIVRHLLERRITGTTAKELLAMTFDGDTRDVETIIQEENLGFQSLSREEYMNLAQGLIERNGEIVHQIQNKGKHGKIQWLIGQMMRQGKGRMEASKAEATLKEMLGLQSIHSCTSKELGDG